MLLCCGCHSAADDQCDGAGADYYRANRPGDLLPATLGNGVTPGQVYTTEPGMTGYLWNVSGAGCITSGKGTESITVDLDKSDRSAVCKCHLQ